MPHVASRRGALISYAAGLAVIAGLMAIVALAGSTITVRQTVNDIPVSNVAAQKQP